MQVLGSICLEFLVNLYLYSTTKIIVHLNSFEISWDGPNNFRQSDVFEKAATDFHGTISIKIWTRAILKEWNTQTSTIFQILYFHVPNI